LFCVSSSPSFSSSSLFSFLPASPPQGLIHAK
jgi:hypothetical protein